MDKILELKNINKIYGTAVKTQVLTDISTSFTDGSFNSIIGQSGSGKSTLMPGDVTPDQLYDALLAADLLGQEYFD